MLTFGGVVIDDTSRGTGFRWTSFSKHGFTWEQLGGGVQGSRAHETAMWPYREHWRTAFPRDSQAGAFFSTIFTPDAVLGAYVVWMPFASLDIKMGLLKEQIGPFLQNKG